MNLALQYKDTPVLERTTECCHEFDPSEWDYVQHDWNKKLFLQVVIPGVFHNLIPGFISKAIGRMTSSAKASKAIRSDENTLVLTHPASAFKSELFMAVTKEVPGQLTVRMNGSFISRVFEGRNEAQCVKGLNGYLASLGKRGVKYYFYRPYCSSCAKKHGHHYTVAIAQAKPIDPYL